MGRGKTRDVVIFPFCFSRILPLLLTRFVLPVEVLSLSQEKERNALNVEQGFISSNSYKGLCSLTLASHKYKGQGDNLPRRF